jgi:hypothetical protein
VIGTVNITIIKLSTKMITTFGKNA